METRETPPTEVERYTVDTDHHLEELYARRENTPHWAREWAQLQDKLGVPCYGYDTWQAWADEAAPYETEALYF